jgi:hypothetical protein
MRHELRDYEWGIIRPLTGSQRTANQITQRLKALAVEQSIDTDCMTGNMLSTGSEDVMRLTHWPATEEHLTVCLKMTGR